GEPAARGVKLGPGHHAAAVQFLADGTLRGDIPQLQMAAPPDQDRKFSVGTDGGLAREGHAGWHKTLAKIEIEDAHGAPRIAGGQEAAVVAKRERLDERAVLNRGQ